MNVIINGQRITLNPQQQIGTGGEGNVFLGTIGGEEMAIKIYHDPNRQRAEKLSTFLGRHWQISTKNIALPVYEARSVSNNQIVGFAMMYLGTQFSEIGKLANRKYRNASVTTTKDVVNIFLDGAETLLKIHQSGLVVGDFSDQNALYRQTNMLWIDVDAWQFSSYACPVGTEDFLDPELYGLDLSTKPYFQAKNDWYSFAIHLFRSLLLAHPYGGTHPTIRTLIKRAQQKVYIFDSAVIYPKIAYSPDLLNDDLANTFDQIFAKGWRGQFPILVLQNYLNSLIVCQSCNQQYPQSRKICPLCHTKTFVSVQQPTESTIGVRYIELIRTSGKIIFSKVIDDVVYAVAYEDNIAVLYKKKSGAAVVRMELFKAVAGATFELFNEILLFNAPQTTTLFCIDISGIKPRGISQIETSLFAGNRIPMFRASQHQLFYIQSGALFSAQITDSDQIQNRVVRAVMDQQTWFIVAPQTNSTGDSHEATVFGFYQVFKEQLFWMIHQGSTYDIALNLLDAEETQLDILVRFSSQSIVIRRYTQDRGINYIRTALVDNQGHTLYQSGKVLSRQHPCAALRGQTYATGLLLHPSDQGIIQEKVDSETFKTFATTQTYVQDGDRLDRYQSGLLVTQEDKVFLLII